jgi:hypothetical protein
MMNFCSVKKKGSKNRGKRIKAKKEPRFEMP